MPLIRLCLIAPVAALAACDWVDSGVNSNLPPVSYDDYYQVKEGGTLSISSELAYQEGVLANDRDGGSRPLSARLVEPGEVERATLGVGEENYLSCGDLEFNPDGSFTYIHNGCEPPPARRVGYEEARSCDFFVYVANDGIADSEPKRVCMEIIPVNDPPVISGQHRIRTREDTPLTIKPSDLVVHDPDNRPEELRVIVGGNGMFYQRLSDDTIIPDEDYSGALFVELALSDGDAFSNGRAVRIDVIPVDDPAELRQSGALKTAEETPLQLSLGGKLLVYDPDDEPEDFLLEVVDGHNYKTGYDVEGRPTLVVPDLEFNGVLDVQVTLTGKDGNVTGAIVKVQVSAVNDAPRIVGQKSVSVLEDEELKIGVERLRIEDPDSSEFSLRIAEGDGRNYTRIDDTTLRPGLNFYGRLSVPVTVSDGELESAPFPLEVDVLPQDDAAEIRGDRRLVTLEDTPLTIRPRDLGVHDPDSSVDELTLTVRPGTGYSIDARRRDTIIPNRDFHGELKVPVVIGDPLGGTQQFEITVRVRPVNDAPVFDSRGYEFRIDENSHADTAVGRVRATDAEGDRVRYIIESGNRGDAFRIGGDGILRVNNGSELDFEHNPVFELEIRAVDRNGARSDSRTILVHLNNANDGPPRVRDDQPGIDEESVTVTRQPASANNTGSAEQNLDLPQE